MSKIQRLIQISLIPRLIHISCMTALAVVLTTTLTGASNRDSDRVTSPPPVPTELEVPEGNRLFFVGRAFGTQNYICLPTATGFAWTLVGPQANLFDHRDRQITTHFLSPNPDEGGLARATWQHSDDTSAVWARAVAISSDPAYVAPGAIPWLRLEAVGDARGPHNGRTMTPTTWIQRLNTTGGVAPATGCAASTDVGVRVYVPYTADYFFYKKAGAPHSD
jgi:hypothetical protein